MEPIKGKIKAISVSKEKGTSKENVPDASLEAGMGIAGDAHYGFGHRQISLLGWESINKVREKGFDVKCGDYAENIATEGIDLNLLEVGTKLKLGGEVELEITQRGKKCHSGCDIFKTVGDCIMPREGIFAKVNKSGQIKTGDMIRILK